MKAALVGDHIGPSLTPALHTAEGAALGLAYQYERIDTGGRSLSQKALRELLDEAENQGFAGLNITHPHKAAVVPLMDSLAGPAKEIETVNTVVFRDGERIGHNTDYSGFRQALLDQIGPITQQEVLIAGAGGAGRAVALALADSDASAVWILDAQTALARELVAHHGALRPQVEWRVAEDIDQVPAECISGFVNCTPMGMANHPGMALDPSCLVPDAWVAEIVYFPRKTQLVTTAESQGRRVMDGTGMALWQAVDAFSLITGHKPDPRRMERHLTSLLEIQTVPEAKNS